MDWRSTSTRTASSPPSCSTSDHHRGSRRSEARMEPIIEVQQRLPQLLHQLGPALFELDQSFRADMRVPARIVADEELLRQMSHDHSLIQLINVTTLPGIQGFAIGMPDMHEGYGFPVGGVAGTLLPDGVISPGGIGFDINCGVRLLATGLRHDEVRDVLPA